MGTRELVDRRLGMLAAESALAKDWLTPEEDAAWASLDVVHASACSGELEFAVRAPRRPKPAAAR